MGCQREAAGRAVPERTRGGVGSHAAPPPLLVVRMEIAKRRLAVVEALLHSLQLQLHLLHLLIVLR